MKVLVDGEVKEGTQVDQRQLDALALWLCRKDEYCISLWHNAKTTTASERRFESECKENGGYCDECRNHAGRILAKFALVERES